MQSHIAHPQWMRDVHGSHSSTLRFARITHTRTQLKLENPIAQL